MNVWRKATGIITQLEANAQDTIMLEQRSRNFLMEDLYPFTQVTKNESLALKVLFVELFINIH